MELKNKPDYMPKELIEEQWENSIGAWYYCITKNQNSSFYWCCGYMPAGVHVAQDSGCEASFQEAATKVKKNLESLKQKVISGINKQVDSLIISESKHSGYSNKIIVRERAGNVSLPGVKL